MADEEKDTIRELQDCMDALTQALESDEPGWESGAIDCARDARSAWKEWAAEMYPIPVRQFDEEAVALMAVALELLCTRYFKNRDTRYEFVGCVTSEGPMPEWELAKLALRKFNADTP